MILALQPLGPAENQMEAKKKITEAVKMTAQKLGNRPSACRAYYIHPAIPAAYLDGRLFDAQKVQTSETGLRPEERIALGLVQHCRRPRGRFGGKRIPVLDAPSSKRTLQRDRATSLSR